MTCDHCCTVAIDADFEWVAPFAAASDVDCRCWFLIRVFVEHLASVAHDSLHAFSVIADGDWEGRASCWLNPRGGRTGATRSHAQPLLQRRAWRAWRGPDWSGRVAAPKAGLNRRDLARPYTWRSAGELFSAGGGLGARRRCLRHERCRAGGPIAAVLVCKSERWIGKWADFPWGSGWDRVLVSGGRVHRAVSVLVGVAAATCAAGSRERSAWCWRWCRPERVNDFETPGGLI